MRVLSRVALVVIAAFCFSAFPLHADHLQADCPLTLVGNNPASSDFSLSPHGAFRSGSQIFVLRGQTLSTYTVTDLGDLQIAREDFIGSLGARESTGGVTFSNGFLYVSSEAGLEIFDLRNVRAGGSAPVLVSRSAGLHYRRLAVSGNLLAGLFPSTDMPCYPSGTTFCFNTIDLFDVTNRATPFRVGSISSLSSPLFRGFNDIAFNQGFLYATGEGGNIRFQHQQSGGTGVARSQLDSRQVPRQQRHDAPGCRQRRHDRRLQRGAHRRADAIPDLCSAFRGGNRSRESDQVPS
jgi:hypothetical protein